MFPCSTSFLAFGYHASLFFDDQQDEKEGSTTTREESRVIETMSSYLKTLMLLKKYLFEVLC